ncbi:SpoIIE family protein phosphatase [Streptomyces apricus]|nr:SpoIIE family protein phosphatase [Streptomyces apricus]
MVGVSDGQASGGAAPSGRPLLSLTLATLMDDVDAFSGAVYLLVPGEPVLEMAVMAGLPRTFAAPWERLGLTAPVPVAEAVRHRQLVWVSGEEDMARRYPRISVVLPYPFALAAMPVATDRAVYGAVFVTWPGTHSPELPEEKRERLMSACGRLARRLERAQEKGDPVRPEPDLLAPAPMTNPAGTLGTAEATRMVARLPYGLCALDLQGRITFVNAAGADLLGLPVSALLGTQLWASVPWLNDPVYEDRYQAALVSQRATAFVALRPPSDWLSFRFHPSASGLSLRITRARAVAREGAVAFQHGDTGTRLVSISQVLSLAGSLTEAVGVQDVVQLVADEIVPAVGGQGLVMLGSGAGRLHVLGQRGYPDPRELERFDGMSLAEHTPGTHALRTGVPAFFASQRDLARLYPDQRPAGGMAAWAYLPLIASGRPIGTWVMAYTAPHPFPADERAVLVSISGLVAQALDRARLYDAKHRLAHGLQAALLPPSLPSLPGIEAAARYLPATRGMEIGGDFYDLVPLRGGEAAAVIGDVQGHNVTAAGLMGQIRTAVRAYTTVGQPPGEVMRSTNRLLIDLGAELFASCVYLRLDPARGQVVMARAGHPPPLLRTPDGTVRVLDLAGGPLLGIDPDAVYPTTEVALPPGSLLALYTDGLVESPGVDIDDALAGCADRLAETGDAPLDEVADTLVHYSGTAEERVDDVALLLLRATKSL